MASADGDVKPPTAEAQTTVETGDATPNDGEGNEAKPTDAVNATDGKDGTDGTGTDGAQDNTSSVAVDNTATASTSATASPSTAADAPDSPPRIVSDIAPPAAVSVSVPPRPAAIPAAAPPPSVASPARTASPTVNGLGPGPRTTRSTRSSMSNTPHRSPALPSPPVPLRPSPVAIQPAPVHNGHTKANKYQNNPTWRAESPRDYKKPQVPPVAIPPPASSTPAPAAIRSVSFPSPGREHIHADQKFLDDKTRITFGIHQAIPEAVRRAVRDNWEKCLLGSDFHQAFILNASIHHATPAAVSRGIRDFGGALISSGRAQIIDAMTRADIEAVAPQILAKASESFLDAALELRLKSIDAKHLINALARAERLGYEPSDVVDEDDDPMVSSPIEYHDEPIPAQTPLPPPRTNPAPPQPRTRSTTQSAPQPALQPGAPQDDLMYCEMCFRKFVYRSAYEHHVTKKVCTRRTQDPGGYKFSCQHCGQGFTTIMGVQYHNAHNVCGKYAEPWRPMPAPNVIYDPETPGNTKSGPAAWFTPKAPASAPAAAPKLMPTPKSTPGPSQVAPQSSPDGGPRLGTPGLHTPNGAVADPYAHLSPEQLAAMQEELRQAELSYGERFRQAREIQDDAERKTKLDGLSNSFGTKQSLIRKKYGVRLRMRRTKAEIQAERDRMKYKTAAELAADNGFPVGTPGRPGRPPASTPSRPPTVVARRSNGGAGPGWASVNRPGAPASASAPQAPMGGAEPVSNKRRLSGSSPTSESKRVAYAAMGGLVGGTAAHVETVDPTMPHVPGATGLGTADEPMALDDSDSNSEDSNDEGSADDDIPAQLPPSVRQSLQQQQAGSPSVTPGPGPQPGSG